MSELSARPQTGAWLGDWPKSRATSARLAAFLLVVVALGAVHIPPATFQGPMVVTAWTATGPEAIHQLHGLFNGGGIVLLYASLLALLYRPARRPAVVVFVAAVVLASVIRVVASPVIFADAGMGAVVTSLVLAAALVALAPGMRGALRPERRIDPILAGIAGVGAVLALGYAVQQVGIWIALSPGDPHTQFAHWMLMANTGVLAAFGVALGAARLRGSRLPLWLGALTAGYLAVASILLPGQASALSAPMAVVVLLVSVAAVARFEMLALGAVRDVSSQSRPAAPRPGPAVAGG